MAHQSPAYVQKQLGNSLIFITVDTYGHWISGEGREGLEKALLGSVRGVPDNWHSYRDQLKENNLSRV